MKSPEEDVNPETGGARAQRGWLALWWKSSWVELCRRLDVGWNWLSRASVTAVESWRKRRRTVGERTRVGGIVAAALICLTVVVIVAAWPGLVGGLGEASRAANSAARLPVSAVASRPQQAAVGARAQPSSTAGHAPAHSPTPAPTSAPVGGEGSQIAPAPQPAPQLPLYQQPAPQQQPANQPPAVQQAVQQPPPAAQPAAPPPPPQTPPGSRIVQTSTSGWNYVDHGGYPNFTGTMVWTTNSGATATWSTAITSNAISVQVWIPNWMAGAVVSYTVTGVQQYPPVQITQEWVTGWQTLGMFASNGTISIVMRYVAVGHPQATPDPACINSTQCTAMAAAQMQLSWS